MYGHEHETGHCSTRLISMYESGRYRQYAEGLMELLQGTAVPMKCVEESAVDSGNVLSL
jgi:hypothetical protein